MLKAAATCLGPCQGLLWAGVTTAAWGAPGREPENFSSKFTTFSIKNAWERP